MCLFVADETIKDTRQANKHAEAKHLGFKQPAALLLFVGGGACRDTTNNRVTGKQFNRSEK